MLWKTAGTFNFSVQQAIVRHVSFGLHPFEIAFFRNLFGLLFVLPWFLRHGLEPLRTNYIGLHVLRATLEMIGMLCFFYALSVTPLAQIAALGFATPIFTTILAVLFLKETVGIRRWAAIFFGFAGTLVALRLGTGSLTTGALVMLLSTVFLAFVLLLVKILSRTDSSVTIISYSNVLMSPMSLVAALFFWQWPNGPQILWLVILGLVSTAASFMDTQGLRYAATHVVMPLEFLKLIWAAAFGFILFSEILDAYTWIGGAMIFASAGYIAYRAARHDARLGFDWRRCRDIFAPALNAVMLEAALGRAAETEANQRMAEQSIDQRNFRDALGQFSTGVTVITTLTNDGEPEGLTVNSFNSLSLDPAMILWSLWKDTPNASVFLECEHFAVNILSAEQKHFSDLFSSSFSDRFAGIDLQAGANGVPLLPSCLAYFECRKDACYDGGDHHIFVGTVDHFHFSDGQPLIFFGGQYCTVGEPVDPNGDPNDER